jgi:hypothetical protein
MMTRTLAVAALAAAALALQAAVLDAVVAAPLASALGRLDASAGPAREERIVVSAPRTARAPAKRS